MAPEADIGTVDLHIVALDRGPDDLALLSADERERAQRLRFARDRDRFIAGRAAMRRLLGAACGRDPAGLVFAYGPAGKPSLAGGPQFNLSHTGDIGALAIADFELGIDIELVRPVERDVAARFFAADEVARLDGLTDQDWLAAFYRCWTCKEAFIKARGEGLGKALDTFSVGWEGDGTARLLRVEGDARQAARWTLWGFAPAEGIAGAIAGRRRGLRVTLASRVDSERTGRR
jgi:4'-phosphopantetheinyl transferase